MIVKSEYHYGLNGDWVPSSLLICSVTSPLVVNPWFVKVICEKEF